MTTWYIRRYVCDNGIEYKTKFPVREDLSKCSSSRKKSSAVHRAEKGATEAAHEFGRLLNCNFRVGQDFHILLTYSDEGLEKIIKRAGSEEMEALILSADREYDNFLRRVKRRADKQSLEVKAAAVISITDPKTGELVRIHHHLVVNAAAALICSECWTVGESKGRVLWSSFGPDLQELADYMISQAARVGAGKRYTHTRNLVRAIATKAVKARNPVAELAVPRGCEKIWRSESKRGRAQHLRYYRPPAVPPGAEDEDAA